MFGGTKVILQIEECPLTKVLRPISRLVHCFCHGPQKGGGGHRELAIIRCMCIVEAVLQQDDTNEQGGQMSHRRASHAHAKYVKHTHLWIITLDAAGLMRSSGLLLSYRKQRNRDGTRSELVGR